MLSLHVGLQPTEHYIVFLHLLLCASLDFCQFQLECTLKVFDPYFLQGSVINHLPPVQVSVNFLPACATSLELLQIAFCFQHRAVATSSFQQAFVACDDSCSLRILVCIRPASRYQIPRSASSCFVYAMPFALQMIRGFCFFFLEIFQALLIRPLQVIFHFCQHRLVPVARPS